MVEGSRDAACRLPVPDTDTDEDADGTAEDRHTDGDTYLDAIRDAYIDGDAHHHPHYLADPDAQRYADAFTYPAPVREPVRRWWRWFRWGQQ